MAMNLLDIAKSYLSDDVVGQVGTMLGENQQQTQTAINGALPVVLGGLIQKSAEPGGIGSVMDMIAEVTSPNRAAGEVVVPDGGVFSQLGSMFDGSTTQMNHFLTMGSGLVTGIFGEKAGAIASALATHSGIKQTSAVSLLSLAGPVVLGVLGKRLAADGDGLTGLAGLLSSQADNVQAAAPPGLKSFLGNITTAMSENPGTRLANIESGRSTTASSPTPPVAGIPAFSNDHTSGGGNRWLPWLLLVLGAVALLYFLRK